MSDPLLSLLCGRPWHPSDFPTRSKAQVPAENLTYTWSSLSLSLVHVVSFLRRPAHALGCPSILTYLCPSCAQEDCLDQNATWDQIVSYPPHSSTSFSARRPNGQKPPSITLVWISNNHSRPDMFPGSPFSSSLGILRFSSAPLILILHCSPGIDRASEFSIGYSSYHVVNGRGCA